MVNPNRFYTYAYLREDRTPYYIGKGSGNRAYKKRKKEIKPPKDKSRIILLKQHLKEEEAFKHEIYMIAVFGRKDLGTGILYNKSDGGEGPSGRVVTPQQIMKYKRNGKKYVKNKIGLYGCSEETMRLGRMKGSMKSKETCSRTFKVKDLNGKVIEGKNVSEFCRERGYNAGNFLQMLYGKQIMAYGYVLPETKITCYEIISPEGNQHIITNFDKFSKFCREHNLTESYFGRMLRGKITHKKWKLSKTFYR